MQIMLPLTLDQVSKKFGDGKQISVQLNDLPSNDFKSVWNNIGGESLTFYMQDIFLWFLYFFFKSLFQKCN